MLIGILFLGGLFFYSCTTDFEEDLQKADLKAGVNKTKTVALELIAENMVSPIGLIAVPVDSKRLFVIDQIGVVWTINAAGIKLEEPFLDVRDKMIILNAEYDERGLLGLAFHPDFETNGRVFAYYTAPPNTGGPEQVKNGITSVEFQNLRL